MKQSSESAARALDHPIAAAPHDDVDRFNPHFPGSKVDRVLLVTLFLICAGLVARFVTSYLAAMISDVGVLDAWLLVDGFSNPRFFGQFLTLALPLLEFRY